MPGEGWMLDFDDKMTSGAAMFRESVLRKP
jgi:hypothetical protein